VIQLYSERQQCYVIVMSCLSPTFCILYIHVLEINKASSVSQNYTQLQLGIRAEFSWVVRCLRPPSLPPATIFSDEARVRCALKSATHPWKSRRHTLPQSRANFGACSPRAAIRSPDLFQQPRPLLLDTFQTSSLLFGKLHVPALAFPPLLC